MSARPRLMLPLVLVALIGLVSTGPIEEDGAPPSATSEGKTARAATVVGRHGVFERSFRWTTTRYANPWEQVSLTMRLWSPSGRRYRVGGFYYARNRLKVRFSPPQPGRWSWSARITDGRREASFRGGFRVVRTRRAGLVRRSPYNRFGWVLQDGSPYYPLGIQDCLPSPDSARSPLSRWGLDGGFRDPGVHSPGRTVDAETYLRAYARAGVNLFRWNIDNCSFSLYRTISPAGNVYLEREGRWGDLLVQRLRRHGFRVYMAIFNRPPFAHGGSAPELASVKRYVRYVVDRFGPYVDFWELMNESSAMTGWYTELARYLRRVDPYRHPISTSYERPDLPMIDINSPHWYGTESEFDSDLETWRRMQLWREHGKPVIVGEQGNSGRSWDPRSGLRMRLRAWTAFFAQGALVFWNSSGAKDFPGNIYLGPEERRYLRVLQRFTRRFDPRARIASIHVSEPALVRGYALRGRRGYAGYLHAYTNHRTPTVGIRVTLNPPRRGTAVWISPASGKVLARRRVDARLQALRVPAFTTDVALKIY